MCKSVVPLAMTISGGLSPSLTDFTQHSRFKENEEDWYKAYGSALAQNHSELLKEIQRARRRHPDARERHRFLLNKAQGISPPATDK